MTASAAASTPQGPPYRDGPTAPPERRHATADVPRSVGG
jgi:hypothetical protein